MPYLRLGGNLGGICSSTFPLFLRMIINQTKGEEHPSDSVFDLLAKIQKRPSMYLGKPSIYHLRCYLDGWYLGNPNGIAEAQSFSRFASWVEKKYEVTPNSQNMAHWSKVIDFWSTDECQALKRFFELMNEFQENVNSSTGASL